MVDLGLVVNGQPTQVSVASQTLLVELLREHLRLTGTHVGCDTSQCGACTVLVDGKAVKSCTMLAAQANGSVVTTIEGVANESGMHPVQAAFHRCHALQCGFCTPGMVMSSLDLLATHPSPDEAQIREWLEGNLCRCTGYHNIVLAIGEAAAELRGAS